MSTYLVLKHSHMLAAYLSIGLFLLRGVLMALRSRWLQHFFFRVVPHVIDTALLAFGIALLFQIYQYPFVHHWLTAKVIGVLVYIVLGSIALKRGRTLMTRLAAFAGAITVFAYIYAVAISKNPLPLHLLG